MSVTTVQKPADRKRNEHALVPLEGQGGITSKAAIAEECAKVFDAQTMSCVKPHAPVAPELLKELTRRAQMECSSSFFRVLPENSWCLNPRRDTVVWNYRKPESQDAAASTTSSSSDANRRSLFVATLPDGYGQRNPCSSQGLLLEPMEVFRGFDRMGNWAPEEYNEYVTTVEKFIRLSMNLHPESREGPIRFSAAGEMCLRTLALCAHDVMLGGILMGQYDKRLEDVFFDMPQEHALLMEARAKLDELWGDEFKSLYHDSLHLAKPFAKSANIVLPVTMHKGKNTVMRDLQYGSFLKAQNSKYMDAYDKKPDPKDKSKFIYTVNDGRQKELLERWQEWLPHQLDLLSNILGREAVREDMFTMEELAVIDWRGDKPGEDKQVYFPNMDLRLFVPSPSCGEQEIPWLYYPLKDRAVIIPEVSLRFCAPNAGKPSIVCNLMGGTILKQGSERGKLGNEKAARAVDVSMMFESMDPEAMQNEAFAGSAFGHLYSMMNSGEGCSMQAIMCGKDEEEDQEAPAAEGPSTAATDMDVDGVKDLEGVGDLTAEDLAAFDAYESQRAGSPSVEEPVDGEDGKGSSSGSPAEQEEEMEEEGEEEEEEEGEAEEEEEDDSHKRAASDSEEEEEEEEEVPEPGRAPRARGKAGKPAQKRRRR